MEKNIKKAVFLLAMAIAVAGCESSTSELLSDELISSNLSKDGEIDPELLIGEWDIIEFAYTADGNKISDAVTISKGRLTIPFVPTPIESNMYERWILQYMNSLGFICSLDRNLIKLEYAGSSTYIYATPPSEECDITLALTNAYSFVIKDDNLFFYFTGIEKELTGENSHYYTEKIKNKNLLMGTSKISFLHFDFYKASKSVKTLRKITAK